MIIKSFSFTFTFPYLPLVFISSALFGSGYFIDSAHSRVMKKQSPLPLHQVHQYHCWHEPTLQDDQENLEFNGWVKRYYNYPDHFLPPRIPLLPNQFLQTICHDIKRFGPEDNDLLPRLGLRKNLFSVWSNQDQRFYDKDNNGQIDIEDEIKSLLKKDYNIEYSPKIFSILTGKISPSFDDLYLMGFILRPFVHSQTQKVFCPDTKELMGSRPFFKVLSKYIDHKTQPLFIADEEPRNLTEARGGQIKALPNDEILVPENILKKIWFIKKNGQLRKPTHGHHTNEKIFFYWPANNKNPYRQGASQKLYALRKINLSPLAPLQKGLNTHSQNTNYIYACIPKLPR